MRRRPAGLLVALPVALLVVCLVACSPSAPAQPTAEPDTSGLSAELSQQRRDTSIRRFEIKLSQADGEPLRVLRMTVQVPGFAGPVTSSPDTRTFPGDGVDLPVDLGEVRCDEEPTGTVTADLVVEGVDQPVHLEAPDPHGLVEHQHAEECATAEVLASAPLAWATDWRREVGAEGEVVSSGDLVVGPVRGTQPVTVTAFSGTVMFTPLPGTTLPVTVEPGATARVPLTLRPTRCDAHVVAEGLPHRGYQLVVRIAVAEGDPVAVTLPPDDEGVRAAMLDAFLEECGLG